MYVCQQHQHVDRDELAKIFAGAEKIEERLEAGEFFQVDFKRDPQNSLK